MSTELTYDLGGDTEILASFIAEVSGHLQVIERHALRLETHRDDAESIGALFGAMHSLKGVTGFLNIASANQVAHSSETLLDRARKMERPMLSAPACDAMLRSVDVLREIFSRVQIHATDPKSPHPQVPEAWEQLLEDLTRLSGESTEEEAPEFADSTFSFSAAPAAETAAAEGDGTPDAGKRRKTELRGEGTSLVRVRTEKLDTLLDAIGELVVTQTQISQDTNVRAAAGPRLSRNIGSLDKIVRDLQDIAMSLRMQSVRDTFARMTRLARDLAHKQGKEIEVVVSGEETELDKNMIEALSDPLQHLIRNAVDHGVDAPMIRDAAGKPPRARIALTARHKGGAVQVEVSDDGRGLNLARILSKAQKMGLVGPGEVPSDEEIQNLIFQPGFSTADRVTEVSGRGVGLDVVRKNVEGLGGHVTVQSEFGLHTTFFLTLPLTLAIIDCLVVRVASERYVLPIGSVVESFQPTPEQVSTVHQRGELVLFREHYLPMIRLHEFARIAPDHRLPAEAIVMVIESGGQNFALLVDEIVGQQQVVIKGLGERMRNIRGVAGGAILGDGRVGLILDLAEVLADARVRVGRAS